MLYNMMREIMKVSIKQWFDSEFLTYQWFITIGVLITFYVVWFILLDKSRATELLLLGALACVAYAFNNLIISTYLGLVEYKIRVMPITPSLLFSSVTLCPIILMIVQQYTTTWKGYFLWAAIGLGGLSLIFAIYTWLGILQWHNGYNALIHFIVLFAAGIGIRAVYLWVIDSTKRNKAIN